MHHFTICPSTPCLFKSAGNKSGIFAEKALTIPVNKLNHSRALNTTSIQGAAVTSNEHEVRRIDSSNFNPCRVSFAGAKAACTSLGMQFYQLALSHEPCTGKAGTTFGAVHCPRQSHIPLPHKTQCAYQDIASHPNLKDQQQNLVILRVATIIFFFKVPV